MGEGWTRVAPRPSEPQGDTCRVPSVAVCARRRGSGLSEEQHGAGLEPPTAVHPASPPETTCLLRAHLQPPETLSHSCLPSPPGRRASKLLAGGGSLKNVTKISRTPGSQRGQTPHPKASREVDTCHPTPHLAGCWWGPRWQVPMRSAGRAGMGVSR